MSEAFNEQLELLKFTIQSLEKSEADLQNQINTLEDKNIDLCFEIKDLNNQINELETSIEVKDNKINELQQEVDTIDYDSPDLLELLTNQIQRLKDFKDNKFTTFDFDYELEKLFALVL